MLSDEALRVRLAEALALEKAQHLVRLCRRVGLNVPDTPQQEARAFQGKVRFVRGYLEELPRGALLAVAARAREVIGSPELDETIALAEKEQTISELTRRSILDHLRAEFDLDRLGGKLPTLTLLQRVWPLDRMPSQDLRFALAADELWQHTVSNPGDYEFDWLFAERLGLLGASAAHHARAPQPRFRR